MSTLGIPYRGKRKRYTDADIERMEYMRYTLRMSVEDIGAEFGVSGRAIENQLYERGSCVGEKPYTVPDVKGWDFRGMDVA